MGTNLRQGMYGMTSLKEWRDDWLVGIRPFQGASIHTDQEEYTFLFTYIYIMSLFTMANNVANGLEKLQWDFL